MADHQHSDRSPADLARVEARGDGSAVRVQDDLVLLRIEIDTTAWDLALARLVAAVDQLDAALDGAPPPADPRARALWARRHRGTGPRPARQRAPRILTPRRTR